MAENREIYSGVPDDFDDGDRDPDGIEGIVESIPSGSAKCHNCGGKQYPYLLLSCIVMCGECFDLLTDGIVKRFPNNMREILHKMDDEE